MLKVLTSAGSAGLVFPLALFAGYALFPLCLYWAGFENPYFLELAKICTVAALCMYIGALMPNPWHRFRKLSLRPGFSLIVIWTAFLAFVLLVCLTAERIPLVASFAGADANEIAALREKFLKAREGWQASFVYMNALFAGFLIPYCLALAFLHRLRFRWLGFAVFLVYTLCFAEKAFFLKAILPLLYLVIQKRIRPVLSPSMVIGCMLMLLVFVTIVSRVGSSSDQSSGEFFSARYVAGSQVEYMAWRIFSIPVVTAADAIKVFHENYNGEPLMGATSILLAHVSGRERVLFERTVFAVQWGQNETGTGSANSGYITEAYVNFGYAGVVIFSIMIGSILHLFAKSRDPAFQSLWILFCFNIYFAGLIGTLFSNGFVLLLFFAVFLKFKAAAPTKQKSKVAFNYT